MLQWQQKFLFSSSSYVESQVCQILLDSDKKYLSYMVFEYRVSANPRCDVTVFVKGAQNAQFSFRIFPQNLQDFESSYLWNESKY